MTLFPVIGIVKVGSFLAADRYTYLPSLGPFLLGGAGAGHLFTTSPKKIYKAAMIAFMILVSGALIHNTAKQIGLWKDSVTLWSHEIKLFPSVLIAYTSRGMGHHETGNYPQAIADFTRAIELNSQYTDAYYNRGFVYSKTNNFQQAIADYTRTIEIDPEYLENWHDCFVHM